MRRLAIVLSMMALLLAVTPAVQADVSPFVGHWESINEIPGNPDLGDDSRMIINISAGRNGTVNVFFKDFGASACGTDEVTGEPLYAGQYKSKGIIEGDVLSTVARGGPGVGNGAIWCMANPPFILLEPSEEPVKAFTYDPETDTLSDGFDDYFRVRTTPATMTTIARICTVIDDFC